MGSTDALRSSPENGITPRDASVSDPSLDQLRAGDMLDHDGSTWTVTRHERFAHEAGPVDRWTLTCGDDTRLLEHGPGGSAEFQLFQRATLADVAVVNDQPFLKAVQHGEAPDPIKYQDVWYSLVETDARTALLDEQEVQVHSARSLARARLDRRLGGVFGGLGAYLGVPSVLLRVVALLGMIGLLASGIAGGDFSAVWGGLALAVAGAYGAAMLALPSASLATVMAPELSHCWLYEGEEGALILECWAENDWRAYEGRATSPDEFRNILPGERRRAETDPEVGVGTALRRLQEGSLVDYGGRTWEATRHKTYVDGGGSVDHWTLEYGSDARLLEAEEETGPVFRLSRPVNLTEVTIDGRPFLKAVSGEDPPGTVAYQGTEYVLAEEDARISPTVPAGRVGFWARSRTDGVLGGIAQQFDMDAEKLQSKLGYFVAFLLIAPFILAVFAAKSNLLGGGIVAGMILGAVMMVVIGLPVVSLLLFLIMPEAPPDPYEGKRSHSWRYEDDEGFVLLDCRKGKDWSAHAGREVAPHEFENVLPRGEKGFLASLWDRVSSSDESAPGELSGSTPLHQLREGYALDYDLQTWTVTEHERYPYDDELPTDVWTLQRDGEKRLLEYDEANGGTFRLLERASVSDAIVDGESFPGGREEPPGTIEYPEAERTQYDLAEEDVRSGTNPALSGVFLDLALYLDVDPRFLSFCLTVGIVVGIFLTVRPSSIAGCFVTILLIILLFFLAIFLNYVLFSKPTTVSLSHYWVYEDGDGAFVVLKSKSKRGWTAWAGREVEPHEFDNILPPSED